GSIATSSTLRFIGNSVTRILPGTLEIIGGRGMDINAGNSEVEVFTRENVDVWFKNPNRISAQITVGAGNELNFKKSEPRFTGKATTDLPIVNQGLVNLEDGIRLVANGGSSGWFSGTPSISQTGGGFTWGTGADVEVTYGMSVTGGNVVFDVNQANNKAN